ncbi:Uma2 family endonuclease [Microcoleus sp. AR_TQ3_B6]|uniref:Uma2 family endonuclease n=1 Tax=Microcoleus sp. AR_TQ3_B6 TaxID=3055284 RepID=UPI002FCEC49A
MSRGSASIALAIGKIRGRASRSVYPGRAWVRVISPDLAIEIADSSLVDDLGTKRMIYEELGVSEYWVVDVQKAQVIAFKIIANRGSERLTESQVLSGLKVALLEEGLRRSRQTDNTEASNWFLEEVRGNPQ